MYYHITADGNGLNDYFAATGAGADAQFKVFSRWGRQVFAGAYKPRAWPEASTPAGLYFCQFQTGGKVLTGWVEVVK